ncbi:MAG: sigma-70 family RNA polymerase sigma factor [Marinoscillum sp.]
MKKAIYITDQKAETLLRTEVSEQLLEKDETLVWRKFIDGDNKSLIYIYQKYVDVLYTYGCQITTRSEFVRDCIQDLFIYIIDRRSKLSDVKSIKAYLFASLKRKILRDLKKEEKLIGNEGFNFFLEDAPFYISDNLSEEERKIIHKQLNELPVNQREVIYLHFYEGLSYADIATVLNVKDGNVRVMVHRALVKLKERLKPFRNALYTIILSLITFLS